MKPLRSGAALNINPRVTYPPPVAMTLGFNLVESGDHTATVEIITDVAKHANPWAPCEVFCAMWLTLQSGPPTPPPYGTAKASPASTCKLTFSVPSVAFELRNGDPTRHPSMGVA
jgi:hypothetical protein